MGDSKHRAFSGAARRAHEAALKRGMKDTDDVGELFGSMSDISAAADSELGFAEPAQIPPEPAADAPRARALGVAGEPDLDGVPEGFFEPGEPPAHEADELGESDLVLDQSAKPATTSACSCRTSPRASSTSAIRTPGPCTSTLRADRSATIRSTSKSPRSSVLPRPRPSSAQRDPTWPTDT